MANSGNQKLKLLMIMEMFIKKSDEQHPLNATTIVEELEKEGIAAERKSIYRDIGVLQEYGMDIEKAEDQAGFYLASRDFELPELKLLVDAVVASKFITEKKSRELVQKIEQLGSVYQGKHLQRQVVVSDRVKTSNESIYYAIDEIYQCIDNNHKMSFMYMEWSATKEQVPRHDGKIYVVSPEFLLWDNEYYYLVAYDEELEQIRHYRVDKIKNAEELSESRNPNCGKVQKADYAKKRFSMFAGHPERVSLRVPKEMIGVLIDRFGQEIWTRVDGDDVVARLDVEVSEPFFGWLAGLGTRVVIEGPQEVQESFVSYMKEIVKKYE